MFKTLRSKIIAWALGLIGFAAAGVGTGVLPYQQFMPGITSVGGPLSGLGGSGGGGAGGGGGGGVGIATINFLQCASDSSDTNVYTYSSQNTGTAGTNRDTIVVVLGRDGASTTFGVSGVTIGGDAATEIVDEDGTGSVNSAIYIFSNDAGTSETIEVTWSEAITDSTICVWSAYDLTSTTAVASVADDDTSSGNLILSLNFTGEGVAVGGCIAATDEEAATWTGFTEKFEANSGDVSYSPAHYSSLSSSSPLTVGCNWTGSADASGVSASFR